MTTGPEPDATPRVVDNDVLDILFRKARTHNEWLDRPVGDDVLRTLYEVMKWGPTSGNLCPVRILFLRTAESKERLVPCLAPGNVDKTRKAPVTALIGFDLEFYRQAPKLFPARPEIGEHFGKLPSEVIEANAFRNGTLQGGYFILAARARPRLRTDLWFRQRESGCGILRGRKSATGLRRRERVGQRSIELPLQSRLRRPVEAIPSESAP